MDEFVILWVGAVAGSMAVAIVWGVVSLLSRRRGRNVEKIMTSVEEKWVDIDSMVAGFRAGRITADALRESLAEKLEAIERLYKPYLHRLDIYFVKYTEQRIEDHSRLAGGNADRTMFTVPAPATVEPEPDERLAQGATSEEIVEAARAEESGGRENLQEQTVAVPEPVFAPPFPASGEEEPVIAAMVEAATKSSEEDELPLETFLEMETGAGAAAEAAVEEKNIPVTPEEAPAVSEIEEQPPAFEPVSESEVIAPAREYPEEPMTESPFAFSGRVSSAEIPAQPVAQPEEAGQYAAVSQEPEETFAEAAVPFPVKMPGEPEIEQHSELPQPSPTTPEEIIASEAAPVSAAEEVAQPMTFDDVEAETIIADRSELFASAPKKAAEPQAEKSSIGITGDDVSDMLDQFFGSKR